MDTPEDRDAELDREIAYHEGEIERLKFELANRPQLGASVARVIVEQEARGWTRSTPVDLVRAAVADEVAEGIDPAVVAAIRRTIDWHFASLDPIAYDDPVVHRTLEMRADLLKILDDLLNSRDAAFKLFEAVVGPPGSWQL